MNVRVWFRRAPGALRLATTLDVELGMIGEFVEGSLALEPVPPLLVLLGVHA